MMTSAQRNLIPTLVLFFAFVFPSISLARQYVVTKIVDGDTVWVSRETEEFKVRLAGIDSPEPSKKKHEPGQPFSQQASRHMISLVLNKVVDLKTYGTDRDGRTLGELFLLNGTNANLEMVRAGLAEVYRGTHPSGFDTGPYWKAEEEARRAGKGMWVLGDKYVSPREWRRTHGN